jgi:hypothetical protein
MDGTGHRYADSRDAGDGDAAWDDRCDAPRRRSHLSRLFGLLRLALILTPLAILLYGYRVADCRPGGRELGGESLVQVLQAGICARDALVGAVLSLEDDLKLIRRAID